LHRNAFNVRQRSTHESGVLSDWSMWIEPAHRGVSLALMGTTSRDIDRRIQRALASVRTDLDSFTDREAFALMLSGYRMAQKYLHVWVFDWLFLRAGRVKR